MQRPWGKSQDPQKCRVWSEGRELWGPKPMWFDTPVLKNMKQVAKLGKSGYFTTKPDSKLLLKFGTAGATASQLD